MKFFVVVVVVVVVFEGFQKHLQGIWDHINSNFSKAVFHNFIWSILQYLDPFVNLQCTEAYLEPNQTFKMDLFAKIILKRIVFAKSSRNYFCFH